MVGARKGHSIMAEDREGPVGMAKTSTRQQVVTSEEEPRQQREVRILPDTLSLKPFGSWVHPLVRKTLDWVNIESPVGGRLKFFSRQWRKITCDPAILEMVDGWEINFHTRPQHSVARQINLSGAEQAAVDQEIESMLKKGAISEANSEQGQVLSGIFLRDKKDGSSRPILNLKCLNNHIPYVHFKMESLKNVKDMLRQGDLMVKIDLKDAYFTLPLHPKSRKYVRFQWGRKIYQFLCLCFGLGPAPRLFTKLMKVPIALLRRLKIRLIIYLDDILIMGSSAEEILMARDTVIYVLQAFVINWAKSVLEPAQEMEFLGIMINSVEMSMLLTEEKISKLSKLCKDTLTSGKITVKKMGSLLGKLIATAAAVTPCMLQVRFMQQLHIQAVRDQRIWSDLIWLDQKASLELKWWIGNLQLREGKPILTAPPDLVIHSDAAKTGGWGAECRGVQTGGQWSRMEAKLHINELEMIAAELAIKTFQRMFPKTRSILLKIDNMSALSYIIKMGGTGNVELIEGAKRIWDFLLPLGITLTAEYIPTKLNVDADFQSRNVEDSSEWKLNPEICKEVVLKMGRPQVDLFASRTSHQLNPYMSLKADPSCWAVDALQQDWAHLFPYAFPPFNLIGRVLKKVRDQKINMILIAPLWVSQPWYPSLLEMAIQEPILVPWGEDVLQNPQGEKHPLVLNGSLHLTAWLVSGQVQRVRNFQRTLEPLSPALGPQELDIITTHPGRNFVAGVIEGKLIQFRALWD